MLLFKNRPKNQIPNELTNFMKRFAERNHGYIRADMYKSVANGQLSSRPLISARLKQGKKFSCKNTDIERHAIYDFFIDHYGVLHWLLKVPSKDDTAKDGAVVIDMFELESSWRTPDLPSCVNGFNFDYDGQTLNFRNVYHAVEVFAMLVCFDADFALLHADLTDNLTKILDVENYYRQNSNPTLTKQGQIQFRDWVRPLLNATFDYVKQRQVLTHHQPSAKQDSNSDDISVLFDSPDLKEYETEQFFNDYLNRRVLVTRHDLAVR